ncbi:MAG: hypothetical protein VKK59_03710, partial [Vampirovibrionales bacterium]|nr:hypothetical protein [Vampirovibrionales bacterium]
MTVILRPETLHDIPFDLVRASIRDIPDHPKPGILFKDITTALRDPKVFKHVLDYFELRIADHFAGQPGPDYI